MKTIFLSSQFDQNDHDLVSRTERLIQSHNIRTVTGKRLGGATLTPEIESRITECDALVALMTRRQSVGKGKWKPSDWVRDEVLFARNQSKPFVALVESGVELGGMLSQHEHIALDRKQEIEAFLSLSETIALWKRLPVKALILPPSISKLVAAPNVNLHCRYRLMADGRYSDWQPVDLMGETGGTFAYLHAKNEQQMLQLEVQYNGSRWVSPLTQQWVHVELKKVR